MFYRCVQSMHYSGHINPNRDDTIIEDKWENVVNERTAIVMILLQLLGAVNKLCFSSKALLWLKNCYFLL